MPGDLLDAEADVGKLEACWHGTAWKGYKKKSGGADAAKLASLTTALRQEFGRQERFKASISTMLFGNGQGFLGAGQARQRARERGPTHQPLATTLGRRP